MESLVTAGAVHSFMQPGLKAGAFHGGQQRNILFFECFGMNAASGVVLSVYTGIPNDPPQT